MSHQGLAATDDDDKLWTRDRQAHAIATGLIAGTTYIFMRNHRYSKTESFMAAFAIPTVFGVLKEVGDSEPDPKDATANAIGALGVSLIAISVDF